MKINDNFPTLEDIRDAHSWKRDYERYLPLSRYIFRPIGFVVTWAAIRMKLTSEQVSWLSGGIGILAYLTLLSPQREVLLPGIAILLIFNVLDCVDGSIARTMHTENPYGSFLDSIMVWIDLGFWALVGIMAYHHADLLLYFEAPMSNPLIWLAVGGLASYFSILANYIEMIFDRSARAAWDEYVKKTRIDTVKSFAEEITTAGKGDESPPLSARQIAVIVNHNLRVRETHYLLLIIAFGFNLVDLFLIAYLGYYFSLSIALVFIYARRCRLLRDDANQQPTKDLVL